MTEEERARILDEHGYLLRTEEPSTLLGYVDRIRELRRVAEEERAAVTYDPMGHAEEQHRDLLALADDYEREMHERIGWR